ncbi:hypothetical protein [Bradyrhizobium sp. SZCCHNRI1003]|uniref:hypothetical protein n=1 Tax=Bradyrhizobium sp. SZCCHNRI1003 TaxID=3057275 RepID=UPI0029167CB5|nr:hypothetical protein [Bradyrhizobium sp. SZCCHNRI1003]
MTAFSIMAHALHRELAARGITIGLVECETILRRVVDHASGVASAKLVVPAADAGSTDEEPA